MKLKELADDLFILNSKLLNAPLAISNPHVQPLQDVLDFTTFNRVDDAVTQAIIRAAQDGFVAGVKFMQNPSAAILEEES